MQANIDHINHQRDEVARWPNSVPEPWLLQYIPAFSTVGAEYVRGDIGYADEEFYPRVAALCNLTLIQVLIESPFSCRASAQRPKCNIWQLIKYSCHIEVVVVWPPCHAQCLDKSHRLMSSLPPVSNFACPQHTQNDLESDVSKYRLPIETGCLTTIESILPLSAFDTALSVRLS